MSLAVQGTNKTAPAATTGTSTTKASTGALDEVYSLAVGSRLNGLVAGVTDDTTDELLDLWFLDPELGDPADKP